VERVFPFLIAGIVLLVAGFVAVAVRAYRASQSEFLAAVRDLGFTPAGAVPDLEARLVSLYTPPARTGNSSPDFKVEKVFRKRTGEGEMFVFDLVDTSGDGSTRTEQQAVAVVSPRLDLPAFVVMPRIDSSSVLAPVTNRMLSWVASTYGTPVELPGDPAFSKHYLVSARDPDAVRRFLDPDRMRRLAEVQHAALHAGGDVFTVSTLRTGRLPVRRKLGERMDYAARILSGFST
jgi:hypothetical protein